MIRNVLCVLNKDVLSLTDETCYMVLYWNRNSASLRDDKTKKVANLWQMRESY